MGDSMLIGLLAASVGVFALIAALKKRNRKRRIERKYWVNPYLAERSEKGRFWSDVSAK